jgi:hypothetical protein
MFTETTDEHRWLLRMVGEWAYESSFEAEPGAEPVVATGRERVVPLGDLWIIGEGSGEIPGGGTMHSRMTLGYDPATGRYPGSWIASVLVHMFVYDGSREGDVLTLETEGPAMTEAGGTARYRDIIELVGDDRRLLRSCVQGDDGMWTEFMRAEYRRV